MGLAWDVECASLSAVDNVWRNAVVIADSAQTTWSMGPPVSKRDLSRA